jgi:nitroreductase
METLNALQSRRNVRTYQDRPIPKEDLGTILEAGRRSPSSRNEQRWDFIVCTDRDQLTRLSEVWRGAGFVATSAATIALIAPEAHQTSVRESIHYDLGQATMAMMLAAVDLGIGSGHTAVADQTLARDVLGHPESMFCAWLVALGYPADRPLAPINTPNRRDFNQVVHWDSW